VEHGKRISIIDNIYLQQDIIDGEYEIKTGLTLDGSLFNSYLSVGGNLKVTGKIEDCDNRGIIATGNMELESAENSLIICKGFLLFNEKLSNCRIFCDEFLKGGNHSTISEGVIQAGRYIEANTIGSETGEKTIAEISIAPYYKALMIRISRELRKRNWDNTQPENTDPYVRDLKELEMKYLKALPDFVSVNREEKRIEATIDILPPTSLRIFHLSREIASEGAELTFKLVNQEE
jgi:hypothetical protein